MAQSHGILLPSLQWQNERAVQYIPQFLSHGLMSLKEGILSLTKLQAFSLKLNCTASIDWFIPSTIYVH